MYRKKTIDRDYHNAAKTFVLFLSNTNAHNAIKMVVIFLQFTTTHNWWWAVKHSENKRAYNIHTCDACSCSMRCFPEQWPQGFPLRWPVIQGEYHKPPYILCIRKLNVRLYSWKRMWYSQPFDSSPVTSLSHIRQKRCYHYFSSCLHFVLWSFSLYIHFILWSLLSYDPFRLITLFSYDHFPCHLRPMIPFVLWSLL